MAVTSMGVLSMCVGSLALTAVGAEKTRLNSAFEI